MNSSEITTELIGQHLGDRTVSYAENDVILYALAVGASEQQLDLVFEDKLRPLPTFGLTLAQWAPDILATQGVFDNRSVHGSQQLEVHRPLPREGELTLSARVGNVWDKGSAALVEVVVECDFYTATWTIFAPGRGGFGGDRGPQAGIIESQPPVRNTTLRTFPTQAVLYRLTGDRRHIHVDPEASARIGQPKPILQGLATLAAVTLPLADQLGAHPADLSRLAGRFSGPVVPGDELVIHHWEAERASDSQFEVFRGDTAVIQAGEVAFS